MNAAPPLARLPRLLRLARRSEFPRKLGILERLFGAALARLGVTWVETASGIPWKLDLRNPTHRWIVYGKYEGAAFLDWAREWLPADGVVVDSGANIGQMAQYFATFVPRGRVLAFEPHPAARAWLLECLARNRGLPVEVFPEALAAQAGDLRLAEVGSDEGHGAWSRIDGRGEHRIAAVRLADRLAELGIASVDLWKLDVEGAEPEALAGAEPLLRERAIRAVYVELGFGRGAETVDALARHGYRGHVFTGHGRLAPLVGVPEHANALFLPAGARDGR